MLDHPSRRSNGSGASGAIQDPFVIASALYASYQVGWYVAIVLHEIGHVAATRLIVGGFAGSLALGPDRGETVFTSPEVMLRSSRIMQLSAGHISAIGTGLCSFFLARRARYPQASFFATTFCLVACEQLAMDILGAAVRPSFEGDVAQTLWVLDQPASGPIARTALLLLAMGVAFLPAVLYSRHIARSLPRTADHRVSRVRGYPALAYVIMPLTATISIAWFAGLASSRRSALAAGIGPVAATLVECVPFLGMGVLLLVLAEIRKARLLFPCAAVYLSVLLTGQCLSHLSLSVPASFKTHASCTAAGPADADAFSRLRREAIADEGAGDYLAAAAKWRKLLEMSPSQSILAFHRGVALYKAGHLDDARTTLQQALHMLVDGTDRGNQGLPRHIQHWLGRVDLAAGDWSRACEHFREQLRLGWTSTDRDLSDDPHPFMSVTPGCDSRDARAPN